MFRDREKALHRLQEQLLEEEDDLPEDPAEEDETVYDDPPQYVHAYNTDSTDADLEDYSDAVYQSSPRKSGCILWFVLLTAMVLLVISWFLAKQGGLL